MSGYLTGMGPCYIHGGLFAFDPDLVNTVLVDPVTRMPPDVQPDPGTPALDERMARSYPAPVCVPCCRRVNERAGYDKFVVLDRWQEGDS